MSIHGPRGAAGSRVAAALLRHLEGPLELRGGGGWDDRARLLFWEGYAHLHRLRRLAKAGADLAPPRGTDRPVFDASFFRAQVLDNILPFWRSHAPDRDNGGFNVQLDRYGRPFATAAKHSAMQARMVYAFTVGHRWAPDVGYLELAEHGVRFLTEQCWDARHLGFYQEVGRDGAPRDQTKRVFDQAYVAIGLLAYLEVVDDATVWERVEGTLDRLDRHAWDAARGGYAWSCTASWGHKANSKTVCAQLDMLAAYVLLHRLRSSTKAAQRIRELARLIMDKMRDPRRGWLLEQFHPDWRYQPNATRDKILLGHNLKATSLLIDVYEITGDERIRDQAMALIELAWTKGWDIRFGGFYQYLFRNGIRADERKLWWAQSEGLAALYRVWELTRNPGHLERAEQAAAFAFSFTQDSDAGGWYRSTQRDGSPRNVRKGAADKAAFHSVQACEMAVAALVSTQRRLARSEHGAALQP